MKRTLKALLIATLVAAPFLSSCSEQHDPTSANAVVERQDGLIGDVLNGLLGLVGSLITGPDANGDAVTEWIGPAGGTLTTAAYTLTVPAGAVSEATRFRIAPTNTGTYSVDLSAYKKRGLLGLSLIEVGSQGFAKPVKLIISYANATNVQSAPDLVIIYIRSNGTIELQTSIVNTTTKTVTSPLSHFSKYAMAQN